MAASIHHPRGFSFLEVLLAISIITPALLGATMAMQNSLNLVEDRPVLDTARYLADDGLARVLNLYRADPLSGGGQGLGSGESLGYADDIDDLIDFAESPPVDGAGNTIGAPGEWVRSFDVEWVSLDDPTLVVANESTKLVRLTISILHESALVHQVAILLRRP